MPNRRDFLACAAGASLLAASALPVRARAGATLQPYRDDAEMAAALERWRLASPRAQPERRMELQMNVAPAAPAAKAAADAAGSATGESITNVQTAGVDEGGIVKQAGEFLIILRRGRLFTVRVGGDALQPLAAVDAYAPGSDPAGAWYDELLVADRTVVVVGYSYARGGTEVGLFDLGPQGTLAHRGTWHLRSFDYWSSRNYASRLVGRRLVFYSPTLLQPWGPAPMGLLPGWRRWSNGALPGGFQRVLPATRVYRVDDDFEAGEPLALHTVTTVDLGADEPRCESTAVLGPAGRVFYVAANAVHVWTASARRRGSAAVFRLPLDGAAPSALKAAGVPIDQMSFLEDGGHLNVLLRDAGRGEGMWGSQGEAGALALLRVPLAAFGDGHDAAGREHYRRLPAPPQGWGLQNRFVGDWLLWGAAQDPRAWALRFTDGSAEPVALAPGHGVERIESLGRDALLAGNAGSDLQLSLVQLGRGGATLAGRHVHPGSRQGETRTHGFFYRATGSDEGLLGLPVLGEGVRRRGGVFGGAEGSAAVLFLRRREGQLHELGRLQAAGGPVDDACKASCVDWYGNARPIFLGTRLFALMGYEIVEGRLEARAWGRESLLERRRVSFAPGAGPGGRYSPFG